MHKGTLARTRECERSVATPSQAQNESLSCRNDAPGDMVWEIASSSCILRLYPRSIFFATRMLLLTGVAVDANLWRCVV